MSVSKRTRFEVLRRDNHTCRYCGGTAPDVALTVDHVTPVALGGSDDPSNLVAACRDCNAGKASTSPGEHTVAQMTDDALRWAAALQRAADSAREEVSARVTYGSTFHEAWASWDGNDCRRLDENWTATLERWRCAGMPIDLVVDAVEITWRATRVPWRDKYRYMCGIVWSRLTKIQEAAMDELKAASPVALAPDFHSILDDLIDGRDSPAVQALRWVA